MEDDYNAGAINRKFERLIGYDAYNNTGRQKNTYINPSDVEKIAEITINLETEEETIVRKSLDKKLEDPE